MDKNPYRQLREKGNGLMVAFTPEQEQEFETDSRKNLDEFEKSSAQDEKVVALTRRATVLRALAMFGALAIAATPATALEDAEHTKKLAEVTQALQNAPKELELKVNWQVLSSLTTDELKTTLEFIPTAVEIETKADVVATQANTGCRTGSGVFYYRRAVPPRNKLFRLKESVHFCWDYGRRTVTRIYTPEVEAYVYGPGQVHGWRYRGVKSGPTNTPHRDTYGISYYTSYVQANFEYCPIRIGCLYDVSPWIRVFSYRDGSFRTEKG